VQDYRVRAHNTATDSRNKIHDDAVARRYGFAGGLVPGVDVYAYLTHPPAAAWGREWVAGGEMHARFLKPVYEDDEVDVVASRDGVCVTLTAYNASGVVCATGMGSLRATDEAWGEAPPRLSLPDPRHAAEPDVVAHLGDLGAWEKTFHAERASEYLADIRETLDLYERDGIAHPAWLVRSANSVLAANVDLGPWIHVESRTRHHGVVTDGQLVSTRARVVGEYERKGHRFVDLDVWVLADDRVVATIRHVAIYRPRPVE
jgi:acyl-coenzyme A thioesterase PaaI-like protein